MLATTHAHTLACSSLFTFFFLSFSLFKIFKKRWTTQKKKEKSNGKNKRESERDNEAMEEPQNKRQKVDHEVEPETDKVPKVEGEEEEEEEECAEYKLFISVKNIEDEKKKPEKDEAEEEDLGSEDSDEDSEDEEEDDGFVIYEWEDLNFGKDVLEKVKKMSHSLYDHSDEGFQEIESATEKQKEGELITLENVAVGGMLVLKIGKNEKTAEITQLFTDPEHRDNGIGNDLTQVALDYAHKDCGVDHVDVFAVCGSGPFYKKAGFKYVSNEKGDSKDLSEDKDDSEQPERCIMRYDFSDVNKEEEEEEEEEDIDDDDDDEGEEEEEEEEDEEEDGDEEKEGSEDDEDEDEDDNKEN